MKKKRTLIIVGVVVAFVVAVIGVLLIMNKNEAKPTNSTNVNEVVLEDNVIVITDETDEELQPYKIDENNLYFKKNPKYREADVIVSGMTEVAPNGYIRRIGNFYLVLFCHSAVFYIHIINFYAISTFISRCIG